VVGFESHAAGVAHRGCDLLMIPGVLNDHCLTLGCLYPSCARGDVIRT